jgi:hypothetical protein
MRTMPTTIVRVLILGLLLAVPGCNPFVPEFGWPDLLHPGGFPYQRWKASVYDPYPDPNVGPVDEGARPPWYKTPAPQAQDTYWPLRGRFGAPPDKQATTMP